jgi:hypothetical protein
MRRFQAGAEWHLREVRYVRKYKWPDMDHSDFLSSRWRFCVRPRILPARSTLISIRGGCHLDKIWSFRSRRGLERVQNNRLGIRQRWQLTDKAVARIRDAFRASERAVKLDTDKRFGSPAVGGQRDALYERLRPLMATDRSTGFDTHDLRAVAGAFLFEHALGTAPLDRGATLMVILACLQANSSAPAPEDPVWQEVVTIGRALEPASSQIRPG